MDDSLTRRDFVRLCAAGPLGASLAAGAASAAGKPAAVKLSDDVPAPGEPPTAPPPPTGQPYREPARDIPGLGEFDVIVCGGGPAGCAAAVASARVGARTLLVERDGYLGGATVAQLVVPILSTNGVDFQGVWHEFARALQARGGISDLTRYHKTARNVDCFWFEGSVDPEQAKFAWDSLVTGAGAQLLHHALVAGAVVEGGIIRGVLVETVAGRRVLWAKRVVDCTGDAAVCAAAGAAWEQGAEGRPWAMAVAKVYRVGNIPGMDKVKPGLGTPGFGRSIGRRPEGMGMAQMTKIDPLDPWAVSLAERIGRARAQRVVEGRRKDEKFKDIYLVDTAARLAVRSSRRVKGLATATTADAMDLKKYDDGIARSSWEIDIHMPTSGPNLAPWDTPAYLARMKRTHAGDYFDVRYGSLVAAGVDNLLVAGRCLSAEHLAQASLRIQQTCMATGQAAGTAAAMSLAENATPRALDPAKVVARLDKDRAAVEPAMECLKGIPVAPHS